MLPGSTWHRGVDLVAVERAMSGRGPCPDLTEDEVRYAVGEMTKASWSAVQIAERLGVAERTVTRWRDSPGGGES